MSILGLGLGLGLELGLGLGLGLGFLLTILPSTFSQYSCSTPSSFSSCNDLPTLSSSLHFSFDPSTATLSFAFAAPPSDPSGWISWAVNPYSEGMIGSQTLVAYRQDDGRMAVKTFNITSYAIRESPIDFATQDLKAEFVGGVMRIYGKMVLRKGMSVVNQVWQVGAKVNGGVPAKHEFAPANLNSKGKLDLVRGQSVVTRDSTARKRNVR